MGKPRRLFSSKLRWQRVTAMFARDGKACHICRRDLDRKIKDTRSPEYITFDHVIPRSKGGLDLVSNMRLAHALCNMQRGADPITPEEERVALQKRDER